ncbi:MAG: HD-GYP domain-containing protein [Chloroflexi bacterium]|nr:MAG: HD-GYP domain-containing protein [Chloroflexota bacterium]TMF02573.1 MAG: HD-GYP domain-containing protein [Chloroflexota bacterium]
MNRGLRLYLVGIAVPAAAVLGAVLGLPRTPSDPVLAAVLVSIGALAANFPVMIRKNYKVDATPAVDLALVVLFPAATAVALVGLGRFLGDGTLCLRRNPNTGKGRRRPIDLLFNTSQMILAAAAAAIIYHGVLTTGTLADGAGALVAAIAAAAAMYVTTTTLVVIAVAMMSRRSPVQVWLEAAAVDWKLTAAMYAAGYVLALVSATHAWVALVMLAPLAGLQLALKRAVQMRDQTIAAVESMADVVDRRDPYTGQHSKSVAEHAVRIARQMHLPESEVELIRLAARVHDLGKIAVPDEVLKKQGRLTDEEFAIMKQHPVTGADILAKFPEYRRGRELVLAHHERIDGRGYPRGLAGDAIPLGARVIAVADSWDAMTSNRPYRTALDPHVAMAELLRGRGIQWDAAVVEAFATTMPEVVPPAFELEPERAGVPLLRSLGAVAGILS